MLHQQDWTARYLRSRRTLNGERKVPLDQPRKECQQHLRLQQAQLSYRSGAPLTSNSNTNDVITTPNTARHDRHPSTKLHKLVVDKFCGHSHYCSRPYFPFSSHVVGSPLNRLWAAQDSWFADVHRWGDGPCETYIL